MGGYGERNGIKTSSESDKMSLYFKTPSCITKPSFHTFFLLNLLLDAQFASECTGTISDLPQNLSRWITLEHNR